MQRELIFGTLVFVSQVLLPLQIPGFHRAENQKTDPHLPQVFLKEQEQSVIFPTDIPEGFMRLTELILSESS